MTKKSKAAINAYIFIAPAIIVVTIFVVIPLIYSMIVSFYTWSFYHASEFVGFKYYKLVLGDKLFFKSIMNALKLMLIILPIQVCMGFLIALILRQIRGTYASIIKTAIYIPNVISGIIVSLVFMFIYSYNGGILNSILEKIGIGKVAWLVDVKVATFSIAIPAIWLALGFTALLMLAGLNDIPLEYYEAASLDGASASKQVFYITIPLMKNVFLFVIVTNVIGLIQMFELPFILTSGGPLNTTLTPVMLIFNHFNMDYDMGYSISASLLLSVFLGCISALIFKVINSEKS